MAVYNKTIESSEPLGLTIESMIITIVQCNFELYTLNYEIFSN